MAETTTPDYPRGITVEQVWATLMEDRKRAEEDRKRAEEDRKRTEEYWKKRAEEDRKRAEEDRKRAEEDRKRTEEDRKRAEEDRKRTEEDLKRTEEGWKRTEEDWKKRDEEYRKRSEGWKQMREAFRKSRERTDAIVRDVWKKMEENDRRMGYLDNRFGELAEHLVAPGIKERFNELGYHFGSMAEGGYKIFGDKGKIKTEIDLLLENDETIMAVEVKVKPAVKDVGHHMERLKILRAYRNRYNDKRNIMGAIAGAIFGPAEKKTTIEAGLYVIEQSGDTMKINMPDGFIPGKW